MGINQRKILETHSKPPNKKSNQACFDVTIGASELTMRVAGEIVCSKTQIDFLFYVTMMHHILTIHVSS